MSDDERSLDRQVNEAFPRTNRESLLHNDAIPLLSKQIAGARDSSASDAESVRARADEVLEELARLYSGQSSPSP